MFPLDFIHFYVAFEFNSSFLMWVKAMTVFFFFLSSIPGGSSIILQLFNNNTNSDKTNKSEPVLDERTVTFRQNLHNKKKVSGEKQIVVAIHVFRVIMFVRVMSFRHFAAFC